VGLINVTICSWVPLTAWHREKLRRLLLAGGLITQFGAIETEGSGGGVTRGMAVR